ncbi:MAG TPA: hypothetical protein VGD60_08950 [Candidatus Acidoferrales bacterium]
MRSLNPLVTFAKRCRIRVTRDVCGEFIVRGRLGHLYEHDASRFGIVLEVPKENTRSDKKLRARRRRGLAAGFALHQEGDFESVLLFNRANREHAELASLLIGAKKLRQLVKPSDSQLRVRALFSSKARSKRARFDQKNGALQVTEW